MRPQRPPSLADSLGSALALGLVLSVLALGAWATVRTLRSQGPLAPFRAEEARATVVRPEPPPALSPAPLAALEAPPPTAAPPAPSAPPEPSATEPPTATPTPPLALGGAGPPAEPPTSTPTASPPPATATALPRFYPSAAGPDFERGCEGVFLFGYVRDAAGEPLAGQFLNVWSATLSRPLAETRAEPPGWYEVPLSPEPMTWFVQVVDATYAPLSPAVDVTHSGRFVEGSEGCWHQVDFRQEEP